MDKKPTKLAACTVTAREIAKALGLITALWLAHYLGGLTGPESARVVDFYTDNMSWFTSDIRTLIEYDDGRRAVLYGKWGEVGDRFIVDQGARGSWR